MRSIARYARDGLAMSASMTHAARLSGIAAVLSPSLLALAFGCASARGRPSPPPAAASPSSTPPPTYRFLLPNGIDLDEAGRVGLIGADLRATATPDGTMEIAEMRAPSALAGSVPVPPRLGGGYLFWTWSALYRSRTFVGPLEPVAPIPSGDIAVAFGHDTALVLVPGGRRAYDLAQRASVPLSPRGAVDVAGAGDDRVIAIDAVGRALTSIDKGHRWTDVSATLGDFVRALHGAVDEVWFELANGEGAWLQRDGHLLRRPIAPAASAPPTATRSAVDPNRMLERAVTRGVPVGEGKALVGMGAALAVVDLRTGGIVGEPREVVPGWLDCEALSAEEGGLVVCRGAEPEPSRVLVEETGPPVVVIVSHVLDAQPRIEKRIVGDPTVTYAGGSLLAAGSCASGGANGAVCQRRKGGGWVDVDVTDLMGLAAGGRSVDFWVPKEDGGIAAVIGRKSPPVGTLHDPALLDASARTIVPFDREIDDTDAGAPIQAYHRSRTNWIVTRDGVLRGLTDHGSVAVDGSGHVVLGQHALGWMSAEGGRALARGRDQRFWQSTDYGASWIEVAGPPVDPPEPIRGYPECSLVGCVAVRISADQMALPGLGVWLRLGWPSEPPRARPAPEPDQLPAVPDLALAPVVSASPLRRALACVGRDGRSPRWTDRPPAASRVHATSLTETMRASVEAARPSGFASGTPSVVENGAVWSVTLGGRRLLEHRDDHRFANIEYYEYLSGPAGGAAQGLRAVVHLETTIASNASGQSMQVLFTEEFDPSGEVRSVVGRVAGGTDAGAGNVREGPHDVRPVLSGERGGTRGVILVDGHVTFWASGADVRPIAFAGGPCAISGGYVNAGGELLVACQEPSGATVVRDVATGATRLRAPPVFPPSGRRHESAGTRTQAPTQVFEDPDAIAIAGNGSLALLRAPSGAEPATEDDPAWLLASDGTRTALAPWSTLEVAASAPCSGSHDGVRAILQAPSAWIDILNGSAARRTTGMSALVRWSEKRVCLEAIAVGYRGVNDADTTTHPVEGKIVARFTGTGTDAAFVARDHETDYHEPLSCRLVPVRTR